MPARVLAEEIEVIAATGVVFKLNQAVDAVTFRGIKENNDAVVVAVGKVRVPVLEMRNHRCILLPCMAACTASTRSSPDNSLMSLISEIVCPSSHTMFSIRSSGRSSASGIGRRFRLLYSSSPIVDFPSPA